jgi:hypothetical protein
VAARQVLGCLLRGRITSETLFLEHRMKAAFVLCDVEYPFAGFVCVQFLHNQGPTLCFPKSGRKSIYGAAMMTRAKGFRRGQVVKLHDSEKYGAGNAYPLPDGWHDGQSVTVIDFDRGWATVQDEAGRQVQVFLTNIDAGWEEFADGKWRERGDA